MLDMLGIYILGMLIVKCLFVQTLPSFYTDINLGQSVPLGNVKSNQKAEIQQDLLELMGLYSKPKTKSHEKTIQSAAIFMRKLYTNLNSEDSVEHAGDDPLNYIKGINSSALELDPAKVEGADVIVSYSNNVRKGSTLRHERDNTFYFEIQIGGQMKGAELRLYKEVSPMYRNGTFTINLFVIRQGQDWEDKILEQESVLEVEWDRTGWLILDATKAAGNWSSASYMNMGLYLSVVDANGKSHGPRDIGLVGRKGPADKQSFLVGYESVPRLLSRPHFLRNKRSIEQDDKSYTDNPFIDYTRHGYSRYSEDAENCQRHNFYINFRDIGFDKEFLIAPEGYDAFYCAGDCSFPLGIHMNATNHAIVQTLVHLIEPYNVPKPRCAPTQLGSISLLYYDDNSSGVVMRLFREMVIKSCGCH